MSGGSSAEGRWLSVAVEEDGEEACHQLVKV